METLEYWGLLGGGQLELLAFGRRVAGDRLLKQLFNEYDRKWFVGYVYKRLRKLEHEGYIAAYSQHQGYGGKLPSYSLMERGAKALKDADWGRTIAIRRSWSTRTRGEAIEAHSIGLVLQELCGIKVEPRHCLMAVSRAAGVSLPVVRKTTPDLRAGGASIVFEPFWRDQERREAIRRARNGPAPTLWFTKQRPIEGILHEARKEGASRLFAGSFWDFKEKLDRTILTNFEGLQLSLAQACQGGKWIAS